MKNTQKIMLVLGIFIGVFCRISIAHAGESRYCQPSSVPTSTPQETIEPSPTIAPTPTPSPIPCEDTHSCPEQKSTPSTDPVAPTCQEKEVMSLPVNLHVYRKGDQAIVKYWPSGGNLVSVYYKQKSSPSWQYSVTEQNDGYVVINGLGSMDISFAISQHHGCGGGVLSSVVVDGKTSSWVLFK